MQLNEKVSKKLQALPDKPGVYLMRDRTGRVVYVGKAASLRKRVRSYFRQGTLRSADPKIRGLIRSIHDFDFLVVRNEAEATLTEGRMIKDYRPRYNTYFRDDKRFLLLRIDLKESFPRFHTCRIERDDGLVYFGPYASAGAARSTLDFVEKRFGIRQCAPALPGPDDHKHCLNDIVRYCSAPCIKKITQEAYRERVLEACAFLKGERPEYLKEVQDKMEAAAEAKRFEAAAALRDTLLYLRTAVKERAKGTSTLAMKAEDGMAGVEELKEALGLVKLPRVIECYDISNISGTYAVGSMVCAVDGMPRKSRYRLFRIKTVEGIDDPRMMGEVIHRRFARLLKEKGELPDLVLVDGGITQLGAARAALEGLGITGLSSGGLAKRYEELYWDRDGKVEPLRLPSNSSALKVLQRIRDEAHRFALTYHRRLRSKRIRDSALDEIRGIGQKRKETLLAHFGSVDRLRRATVDEISKVPGFGASTAQEIYRALSKREA